MAPLSSFCKQVHFLIFCCKLYFPSFIAKWLLARFRQWETSEECNRAGRRGEAIVFLMMSPSPALRSGYISCVLLSARQFLPWVLLLLGNPIWNHVTVPAFFCSTSPRMIVVSFSFLILGCFNFFNTFVTSFLKLKSYWNHLMWSLVP